MSLRTRIVLLVLLATLTPAALFALFAYQHRQAEIAQAKAGLHALAAYAAESLQDKASGTVQLLHGLSRAPDLSAREREACSAFLGDVLKRYPQFTGLLTIRPDGQLHCDSLRTGRTLDLNDRAYFKRSLVSMEPAFEIVFGRLTRIAVLQVAYPARDGQGGLKYVLLASLNLAQFSARFATASAHPEMEVLLWDDKGTVMVRHPDAGSQKIAGTAQGQSDLYRFARAAQTGATAELRGPDGTMKVWALGAVPFADDSEVRITLGIPREILLAEADADLRNTLTGLVGASLLAILIALLFAELGIRRHLARIAVAAARLGAGDFSARIGAPYPGGELGGLMQALDATAGAVQVQQVQVGHQSEALRRINRTLRMLSAINSTIVRVRDREELFAEACRIAAEEGDFAIVWLGMVDRPSMLVLPVAWHGVDKTYFESVRRSAADPQTIIGVALRDRQAVVVNDIADDARVTMRKEALALGSRALAAFPLIVSGESAGLLVLHARETGFFDAAEMTLLNELAGDVAFALEHIEQSEKLDYLAYYDALTGLANRALFADRLTQLLSAAGAEQRPFALVVMDIERFRRINDTLGRLAGDELLKQIAGRASKCMAVPRWLARISADHFAFVLQDAADLDGVVRRIEEAHRQVFDNPYHVGAAELRVAARFGVARFPQDAADADTLFKNAEAALKKAKASSERYLFYTPQMTERVAEKLTLENQLRLALENEEFVLHYQSKVDAQTRRIASVEALIRWQSPDGKLVPPMAFIPLLEETGLILPVGAWALKRAAQDYREWQEGGVTPPRIAVNVSPIQLRQNHFVRDLGQAIGAGGAPSGIDLEITESVLMEDIDSNIRKLKEVRALGMSIAIDDFGTGYSSLAYLAKLPVDTLKIDRSFIITMLNDPDAMMLVSTIISLAHALRLKVVAEGVDAEEQAKTLRLLRCDEMQGYLFSRPVPKGALLELLRQEQ